MNKALFVSSVVLSVSALVGQAGAQGAPQVAASCAAPQTLNGVWQSNDGGTYAIRQIGSQVWWTGKSRDDGRSWTTVFRGIRTGNTVTGTWADLPFGKRSSAGTLTLRLDGGAYGATSFNRVSATGDLSSAGWLYTCNDAFVAPPKP